MKGALVTFIAKVEGVVKEKFSGARPQTLKFLPPPPPIKIPGGATGPVLMYCVCALETQWKKVCLHMKK